MSDFLNYFNNIAFSYAKLHLEIYFLRATEWRIRVCKKGCALDGSDLEIVNVQDRDMKLCFAKAYVQLKEWVREN